MKEKEVDLRDYINMVRKRWKIILIIFLVFIITSGAVSFILPRTYESIAMVRIGRLRDNLLEEPATIIAIFKTKVMLEKVVEEIDIPFGRKKSQELASKIKIKTKEKSGLLEIKGRWETPEEAMRLVNGVTVVLLQRHEHIFQQGKLILEEYLAFGKKRLVEMEKEIDMFRKKIEELGVADSDAKAMVARGYMESLERSRDRYEELRVELREKKMKESYETVSTQLVIPPTTPEKPIRPKKKQNVLIAGILGLIIGFFCASIVEYFEKPPTIS